MHHLCSNLLKTLPGTSCRQPQRWDGKEGAAHEGCRAELGTICKHIHFMLLPEAISSRMVSNVGMDLVSQYISDSSSGIKGAAFISLPRINRT